MYEHFTLEHPLNKFITENPMHTLADPTGHTYILYSDLSTEALDMNASTFSLNNNFTPSQFYNNSGVYIVYNFNGSESYVGSATDFGKRWANYYNSMYKDNQFKVHIYMLYNSPSILKWSCIIETPAYLKQFY